MASGSGSPNRRGRRNVTVAKLQYTSSDATISSCGTYRYTLSREWRLPGELPRTAVFIGLNPSTADGLVDDPTIRRCVGFAKRLGCNRMEMLNLFAFRATEPIELQRAITVRKLNPIGPENDRWILARCMHADIVVACWGRLKWVFLDDRGRYVRELLRGHDVACLGLTKDGYPRHPLYLRKDRELMGYR